MIARFFLILSCCSYQLSMAEEYNFVSISGLYEQQVGQIILTQIYKNLGISISIKPLPGKRAISETVSGRMDGEIMRIWSYGLEHPETVRIPTPYYHLETMVFYKKGSGINVESATDLTNYSILKVRGVKHTNNITQGLELVYNYDDTPSMLMALDKERSNIALTHTGDGLFAIKKYQIKGIERINEPLSILPLYHYLHKRNSHLIDRVDRQIREMKSSGELEKLIMTAEKQVFEMHGLTMD